MKLRKAYLSYGSTVFYTGTSPETGGKSATRTVERYDHGAASGRFFSYLVGSRNFERWAFRWQDTTNLAAWLLWWDAVKDGTPFYISNDASIAICGDGTTCGDGAVCGQTAAGIAVETLRVKLVSTAFPIDDDEVDGLFRVEFDARRYV